MPRGPGVRPSYLNSGLRQANFLCQPFPGKHIRIMGSFKFCNRKLELKKRFDFIQGGRLEYFSASKIIGKDFFSRNKIDLVTWI